MRTEPRLDAGPRFRLPILTPRIPASKPWRLLAAASICLVGFWIACIQSPVVGLQWQRGNLIAVRAHMCLAMQIASSDDSADQLVRNAHVSRASLLLQQADDEVALELQTLDARG